VRAVGVAGLGLIGGSIARRLSLEGIRVVGCDVPSVRRRALAAGAVAATRSAVERVANEVDIIVLAAPPRANRTLLRRIATHANPGLVITDVSSVKGEICALARRLRLRDFVGGHPIAGAERGGFAASRPDLFEGQAWALTRAGASREALRATVKLVKLLGARPRSMSVRDHDRAMAYLSHVPQLVAWALEQGAASDATARRHRALAGPGFRDMTRLARSPKGLWREILSENADEIDRALAELKRRLKRRA
jgi:prephenate dehydrogenase